MREAREDGVIHFALHGSRALQLQAELGSFTPHPPPQNTLFNLLNTFFTYRV